MKKWVLVLALLLLVGYGVAMNKPKAAGDADEMRATDVRQTPDTTETPDMTPAATPEATPEERMKLMLTVTKDDIYEGDLLLVNTDYPVPPGQPASEAVSLAQHEELLGGYALLDNSVKLSPFLAQKFSTMVEAAENDGVTHFMISSGYRDKEKQGELYREKGADYAMPAGYSEHNLGLSLDVGSTQGEMGTAPEGKWLKENAWKYGFILRYPPDKVDITGIQYEPWHFRYVGLPHSAIMQQKNMVLEEYLDFLKEQQSYTTTIDGHTYQLFYYPVDGSSTLEVPAYGLYDISGNNADGIIVTVHD